MTEPAEPLLIVVGPTGTGKSTLAAQIASGCDGEVVSADSVQVYKHFDIGSGKPDESELGLAPHHLVGVIDPLEQIEANVWADRAHEIIREIRSRGKVPIVCGGTFLWVRALMFGLADAPPGDEAIRERHRKQAEAEGRDSLHKQLAQVDSASAERLHPNDLIRVSRALEVHELTGRTLSEIQQEHGFRQPKYRAQLLALDWPREDYDERVARRVRGMLEAGWKDEVQGLLERGYGEARAMDAVGYRQVKEAVTGEPQSDDELAESITRVTRIFARRQRTWLRDEDVRYVTPQTLTNDEELTKLVLELESVLVS